MRGAAGRVRALAVKETLLILRDPVSLLLILLLPGLQFVIFGHGIGFEPRDVPTVVVLEETGPLVRSVVRALENTDLFEVVGVAPTDEAGERALRTGTADIVVTVPAGFERDLLAGRTPRILVRADNSHPPTVAAPLASLTEVSARALAGVLPPDRFGPRARGRFEFVIHRLYNPASESARSLLPGLLGLILTTTMTLLAALSLVREKARGTYPFLAAAPLGPFEVMAGKLIPLFAFGCIQAASLVLAARFLLDMPLTGPLPAVAVLLATFVLLNLLIGYLFSVAARNELQATTLASSVVMPTMLLSGWVTPQAAMTEPMQVVSGALPFTHFNAAMLALALKEATAGEVATRFAVILAYLAAACLAVGLVLRGPRVR